MVETSENTEILHFQGNKKRRDLRKTRKSRLQTWGSVVQIPTDTSTYLFISTVKLSVKKPRVYFVKEEFILHRINPDCGSFVAK